MKNEKICMRNATLKEKKGVTELTFLKITTSTSYRKEEDIIFFAIFIRYWSLTPQEQSYLAFFTSHIIKGSTMNVLHFI